ncbi:MAG: hypothetical protein Greene07147_29 [Parcubacteria group bacterium Greene0714_7]|nr:MAG: hypothetical protein Greene07147_29 [Parcubacteria group bacterium Greene0714_7]
MKKYIFAFLLLALLGVGAYFLYPLLAHAPATSVQTSVPTYVRASLNDIVVASPKPDETLGSIIDVSGRARGLWYFEASFPVEVVDSRGAVLGKSIATAQEDWMTEEFVPFTATITLTTPYAGPATLILRKDNPSGESSRDASISIPILIQ